MMKIYGLEYQSRWYNAWDGSFSNYFFVSRNKTNDNIQSYLLQNLFARQQWIMDMNSNGVLLIQYLNS